MICSAVSMIHTGLWEAFSSLRLVLISRCQQRSSMWSAQRNAGRFHYDICSFPCERITHCVSRWKWLLLLCGSPPVPLVGDRPHRSRPFLVCSDRVPCKRTTYIVSNNRSPSYLHRLVGRIRTFLMCPASLGVLVPMQAYHLPCFYKGCFPTMWVFLPLLFHWWPDPRHTRIRSASWQIASFPYRRTAYSVSNDIVAELLLCEAQALCASILSDKCCRKRSILSVVMYTVRYERTAHLVANSFLSDCLYARRWYSSAVHSWTTPHICRHSSL